MLEMILRQIGVALLFLNAAGVLFADSWTDGRDLPLCAYGSEKVRRVSLGSSGEPWSLEDRLRPADAWGARRLQVRNARPSAVPLSLPGEVLGVTRKTVFHLFCSFENR